MDNPLISVIVPVYKVEKYLDRCLESIVNQTYTNLEIILVDDGSPDNCPAMCDAWADKDSRIRVFHIENHGVANARNFALSKATGEYIGFVDSDDWTESDMFEYLYGIITEYNDDIAVCGFQINNGARDGQDVCRISLADALKNIALGDYKYGVLWNKLYKREIINGIEMPHFACSEDLVFNYYSFKNAKIIAESDLELYHYFQNENSTVHGKFGIGAFDAVYAKEIIIDGEKDNSEIRPYAVKGHINSLFVVLSGCIQNDMFPKERDELIKKIVGYKKEILKSNMYSKSDKAKTLLLSFSPSLYSKLIKRKYK